AAQRGLDSFPTRRSSDLVVSISGDGGFHMNAQELSVAAAHKLPLKVVIINNNFLGMVRQWQELFHENRFSHTDLTHLNPDYVKLDRKSTRLNSSHVKSSY